MMNNKYLNAFETLNSDERTEMENYCKRYRTFIDNAKIQREIVKESIGMAIESGFKEYEIGMEVKVNDKIYFNNRGKSVIFAVIGERQLSEGCRITVAHGDSPCLDLKPDPLREIEGLALLRTRYYGGIKKYQWVTLPLALHGVVCKKNGESVHIVIGEDESEPAFYITDLLPHLAAEQMKKNLDEGFPGEKLQVLFGSEPSLDETADEKVKHAVLALLEEKYGFVEEDFISAELSLVPAGRSREIGIDRSMIGAYGQDDRVCAYAAFEPLLQMEKPEYTSICILADKEEVGSMGVSGMQSKVFDLFLQDICKTSQQYRICVTNSLCISADVSNAFDPLYTEVSDPQNSSRLNQGIVLSKYTGRNGKAGTSDASAEVMAKFRNIFDIKNVKCQIAELGKVEGGGGSTVAAFMANRNIETLDIGVPLLSMHAPMEVTAKVDCYMMRKATEAFYQEKNNFKY